VRPTHVSVLGCGPGTDAKELSTGRRYLGVDLSPVQLSIARQRVPNGRFLVGDVTAMHSRPASFDGVVALYPFDHVPKNDVRTTFATIFTWPRPGGWLMPRC
jgi:ubiquinone/menaquinone biosynthesis C-methylase UbiE